MGILLSLCIGLSIPVRIFWLPGYGNKGSDFHRQTTTSILPCTRQHENGELCTHLPIIQIDTRNQEIPGRIDQDLYRQTGRTVYTTAPDGQTRITADLEIMKGNPVSHSTSSPDLTSAITLRCRGRSSRWFDKKSYALKLVDEKGESNNQSLLGMDMHHDYVLYGPFLDKTGLRNSLFYTLAGELMPYAIDVRYCELLINGEYQGLYLLEETIGAGKNGSRLPLKASAKNQTYTGYVLKLDELDELNNLSTFSDYTLLRDSRSTGMEIVWPGPEKLSASMKEDIRQDFSAFEKMLYSYDYDHQSNGWKSCIDLNSFVDAYLINELAMNYDFGSLSTYIYKGIDGKYGIALWDYNNAADNYIQEELGFQSLSIHKSLWFDALFRDEDFVNRVIQRYHALRRTCFSEAWLNQYIDETAAYIAPAVQRDRAVWESHYITGHGWLHPEERNPQTWEESIEQLKDFLQRRLNWLDENIESIRQYCAPSRVKSYEEDLY